MAFKDRVSRNTSAEINDRIESSAKRRVKYLSGDPEQMETRLRELDREWDIERVLETNASLISILGLALTLTKNRRWLFLPLTVQSFLLQHAIQGWCPPLPILRRLGFRTAEEINKERMALKTLRGDFSDSNLEPRIATLPPEDTVWEALSS